MDDFYRMTPFEVASGWVAGYEDGEPEQSDVRADPMQVLEELLLPGLSKPPCFVEFSGGRDSSALLAVGVDVARRHGLVLPVPMTRVFPDVTESREDEWQEMVLRHLEIDEWHRTEYTDEFDLLGPTAIESLRRLGLVWPVTLHTRPLIWRAARGSTLVSGEGGDEVFGYRRTTALAGLIAGNVHPRGKAIVQSLRELSPPFLRRRMVMTGLGRGGRRSWLSDEASELFMTQLVEDAMTEPLRWDTATRRHRYRRSNGIGMRNLRHSAEMSGVIYLSPFQDQSFLDALASRGGRLGFPGRSAAMRGMFGGLLPSVILERETKAEFTRTIVRRYTRRFIENWNGDGLLKEFVKSAALKHEWEADRPHVGTFPLIQAAWLATHN
jgi:asparagine synthase (glutamine-hydrolysing)